MGDKVVAGVAIGAVVGVFWERPDLMVLLVIAIGVAIHAGKENSADGEQGH